MKNIDTLKETPADLEGFSQLIKGKRLAIMGGTFDPIHYGHLVTAEVVRKEFNIDYVVFMPSGRPPHKKNRKVSSGEHRFAMTSLATNDNPFFFVSRLEIDRPGLTYTVDTIQRLREIANNNAEIFFITGADAIEQIFTWKDSKKLLGICDFIAVTRPGYDISSLNTVVSAVKKELKNKLYFVDVPALDISSTDLRNRVLLGNTIKYLLPDNVIVYLEKHRLYKGNYVKDPAIETYVKEKLSKKRYTHTQGVAAEATRLAAALGAPAQNAYLAALLHDVAKELLKGERTELSKSLPLDITADPIIKKQPDLIHGYLGAKIAEKKFGIKDKDILNAIKYHTTGRANMSLLEKIVSIADVMENGRGDDPEIIKIRELAYKNVDEAMYYSLNYKIRYIKSKNKLVHPLGVEALNYYEEQTGRDKTYEGSI